MKALWIVFFMKVCLELVGAVPGVRVHLQHHTLDLTEAIYGVLGSKQHVDGDSTISLASNHQRNYEEMLMAHREDGHALAPWLLTVKGPVNDNLLHRLQQYFGEIGDYIPVNTFFVVAAASEEAREHLMAFPGAIHATLLHHSHKAKFSKDPRSKSSPVNLVVHLHRELLKRLNLRDILKSWMDQISHLTGKKVEVNTVTESHNPRVYVRGVRPAALVNVLKLFTRHPLVISVHEKAKAKLQNKFARYIIQTDRPTRTDIWSHEIRGEGEIIAVMDTGIDHDSCYFYDPKTPVPIDKVDHSHRKIVLYNASSDSQDVSYGHGSHVVGSLLGCALYEADKNIEMKASEFNGMAPKAKIAFWDKMASHGGFSVPDDLIKAYYSPAYENAGARLMSNSWGTDPNGYDDMSIELDSFAWARKDFLPIFAAGNYGRKGLNTLSSPGNAKNSLTIGASSSSVEGFVRWYKGKPGLLLSVDGAESGYIAEDLPGFPRSFVQATRVEKISIISPSVSTACSTPASDCPREGCVLAIPCSSSCKRYDQLSGLIGTSVRLVLFEACPNGNSVDGFPSNVTFDAGMLSESTFHSLSSRIAAKSFPVVTAPVYTPDRRNIETTIPKFSSKGPTSDGRYKPDILAPGEYTESVISDGKIVTGQTTCSNTRKMEGTSMATPIAAGGTALVRQYLREGWYPNGRKEKKNAFKNPSAALIKAIIINGAEPMNPETSYEISKKLMHADTLPSYLQGYGRMKLDSSLYFDKGESSSSSNGGPLFLDDFTDGLKTDLRERYCLRIHSEDPVFVKVTLVWTDYPPSKTSGVLLVNNLDLTVHQVGGVTLAGNHIRDLGKSDMQPGSATFAYDELNNVEQVAFFSPNISLIAIDVHAKIVAMGGKQPFAVAVTAQSVVEGTGQYERRLQLQSENVYIEEAKDECSETTTKCPNNCSGEANGVCLEKGCSCLHGWVGPDCSSRATSISFNEHGKFFTALKVATEQWEYYYFKFGDKGIENFTSVGAKNTIVRIEIKNPSVGSDPDMFVRLNKVPTFAHHDREETTCDSCGTAKSGPIDLVNMTSGTYWIGLTAACCFDSEFEFHVTIGDKNSFEVDSDKAKMNGQEILWIVISCVTLVALITFAIIKAFRRKSRTYLPVDGNDGDSVQLGNVAAPDMQFSAVEIQEDGKDVPY